MFLVQLPTGREIYCVWSNISPCSTISEKLVDLLGVEKIPLAKRNRAMCRGMIGGVFGGSREQWYFVRSMNISINGMSLADRSPMRAEVTVGPFLVMPEAITPLSFGADLQKQVRGIELSSNAGECYMTLRSLGLMVTRAEMIFTGPDPDNPGPPLAGSASWMWAEGVSLDTCAACGFEFPNLQTCAGCKQVNYCCKACQRSDWRLHKEPCRQAQAQN
mmetsp:Transcript_29984/g.73820  ORF Transcript_29984/g.73820 Transcript_29984/m.73820 type:complete len:218 (+) Transcript_29984:180-833(+)